MSLKGYRLPWFFLLFFFNFTKSDMWKAFLITPHLHKPHQKTKTKKNKKHACKYSHTRMFSGELWHIATATRHFNTVHSSFVCLDHILSICFRSRKDHSDKISLVCVILSGSRVRNRNYYSRRRRLEIKIICNWSIASSQPRRSLTIFTVHVSIHVTYGQTFR